MTDSKGNKLKVGDVVATYPFKVLVEKIVGKTIYLAREGWRDRMYPGDKEEDMMTKLTQKEMTESYWVKQC